LPLTRTAASAWLTTNMSPHCRGGFSPRIAWPVITFDGPVTFDLGSEQLRMLPQEPAHTDGDLAVFPPAANVLVMGDLFANGSYPVIDESSGGSLRGLIAAVERLLPL
jgi:cyclase